MSRAVSHSTMNMSNSDFDSSFAKFAPSAWKNYTTKGDLKVWAREFARQFVHTYPGSTFLPVYYRLISYADSQMTSAEDAQKTAGTFPAKRTVNPSSTTVPVSRAVLNRILYRETCAWWNAFQMEGFDEDPSALDKFGHTLVGTERFVWHCARVLARNQHSTAEEMVPLVQGWLDAERSSNLDYFVGLHH